jgi:twitching motility protein PilT
MLVDHVNRSRPCHVVTIEHPIEFVHAEGRAQVTQHEVGEHVPDVATGLASATRDDTDVVFVSDLATGREVELALRLAGEGVSVLTTIEASTAVGAIERIVNACDRELRPRIRAQLAESLTGILVQHLVRSADGKGRAAVHEVVLPTPRIAALIARGETSSLPQAIRADAALGMTTLDDALERAVSMGKISTESAFDRAVEKGRFVRGSEAPSP